MPGRTALGALVGLDGPMSPFADVWFGASVRGCRAVAPLRALERAREARPSAHLDSSPLRHQRPLTFPKSGDFSGFNPYKSLQIDSVIVVGCYCF